MEILIVLGIILLFYIIEFNKIKTLQKKVFQSKATIDVYLTQRFDLIPNLIECVKGYAEHEKKVLSIIVEERNAYNENKSLELANKINEHFNTLLALQEAYPDLKASEQFLNLQECLEKIESQLQAARRLYNGDVTLYNTAIETFPSNIFAMIFGFQKFDLFEIEEYKKENVNIDL